MVGERSDVDLNRVVRAASMRRLWCQPRLEGNKNMSSMGILGLPKVTRFSLLTNEDSNLTPSDSRIKLITTKIKEC